jgi:hypothetical protein
MRPLTLTARHRAVVAAGAVLLAAVGSSTAVGQVDRQEARTFIQSTLGLPERDAAALDQGRAVVKTLPGTSKREVTTAGAVRIAASAADFVAQFRTLEGFKRSSFIRQIARFSDPPRLADLDALELEDDDVTALKACRVGDCDVRLPGNDIHRFSREIDWRSPDARERAATLYKSLLMGYLADYRRAGIERLVAYDDRKTPTRLAAETLDLLAQQRSSLDRVPEFRHYLLQYPRVSLPRTEDFFYWSKEAFGFRPVIGLNHVSLHTTDRGEVTIVTTQIYASHYMDGQVGVNTLVPVAGAQGGPAFYWLHFNRARIDNLEGLLATLSRPIIQRRARSGLARSMTDSKRRMEAAR